MVSVCVPSFQINSPTTPWDNGCHWLNRIRWSKESKLFELLSHHIRERTLVGRAGRERWPCFLWPASFHLQSLLARPYLLLTPHTKLPFPYANLGGCLFFFPPEAVWRVQGAHLAGMCASEAGGHTNAFHGGWVQQVLNGHKLFSLSETSQTSQLLPPPKELGISVNRAWIPPSSWFSLVSSTEVKLLEHEGSFWDRCHSRCSKVFGKWMIDYIFLGRVLYFWFGRTESTRHHTGDWKRLPNPCNVSLLVVSGERPPVSRCTANPPSHPVLQTLFFTLASFPPLGHFSKPFHFGKFQTIVDRIV